MSADSADPSIAEQGPIHEALAEHLIECMPSDWDAAELRLVWPADIDAEIDYDFLNPDTAAGWSISEAIHADIANLEKHRRKFALGWHSAKYLLRKDAKGNWSVKINFV